MNWWGSGLITILIYGTIFEAVEEGFSLITEDGANNILTETGLDMFIEN